MEEPGSGLAPRDQRIAPERAPGEQRPPGWSAPGRRGSDAPAPVDGLSSMPRAALLRALAVGLLAAAAWAALRSILGVTIGAIAIAGVGGWGMGAILRRAGRPAWVAAALGALAWLTGLLLAWLLAMAVLPGSSRTLPERLAATPFHEWLAPQLGVTELATLAVFVGAASWAAHRSNAPPGDRWS